MLIQQIMGPLPAFDTLSFESQYLLNVSPASFFLVTFSLVTIQDEACQLAGSLNLRTWHRPCCTCAVPMASSWSTDTP